MILEHSSVHFFYIIYKSSSVETEFKMHKNAEVQLCIRGSKVENASSVICLLLFFFNF